jgi:hypothetical protein
MSMDFGKTEGMLKGCTKGDNPPSAIYVMESICESRRRGLLMHKSRWEILCVWTAL